MFEHVMLNLGLSARICESNAKRHRGELAKYYKELSEEYRAAVRALRKAGEDEAVRGSGGSGGGGQAAGGSGPAGGVRGSDGAGGGELPAPAAGGGGAGGCGCAAERERESCGLAGGAGRVD